MMKYLHCQHFPESKDHLSNKTCHKNTDLLFFLITALTFLSSHFIQKGVCDSTIPLAGAPGTHSQNRSALEKDRRAEGRTDLFPASHKRVKSGQHSSPFHSPLWIAWAYHAKTSYTAFDILIVLHSSMNTLRISLDHVVKVFNI